MATPQYIVRAVGSGGQLDINVLSPDDNVGYAFGTDSDAVFYLSSALIEAADETTGLHAGTSVKQETAANSLIISNITTDGDIQMLVSNDGGHSKEFLFANGDTADLVLGHGMATATVKTASGVLTLDSGAAINIEPESGSAILLDGTISIDAGVVTGVTALTSATVDATTDFTVGDTVITDGVITDSSGLQLAANLDINGTADISGILTMSAAALDLNGPTNTGGLINVGNAANAFTANSLILNSSHTGVTLLHIANNNANDAAGTSAHLELKVNRSAGNETGDPRIRFFIIGGSSWAIGPDNSEASRFAIANDTDLGGSADAVRISTAEEITFQNSTGSDYDYVCGSCGKSSLNMFDCCGEVEWHDDVLAVRESRLSPEGFQHMAKLGILEIDGPDTTSPGWVGINYQKAQNFTWSGMWQNRLRMDSQYEELNKRLEAIGA